MLIGAMAVPTMVPDIGVLVLWLEQYYDWDFWNNALCQRVNLLHNIMVFILVAVQDMLQHIYIWPIYIIEHACGEVYKLLLSTLPLKNGNI